MWKHSQHGDLTLQLIFTIFISEHTRTHSTHKTLCVRVDASTAYDVTYKIGPNRETHHKNLQGLCDVRACTYGFVVIKFLHKPINNN